MSNQSDTPTPRMVSVRRVNYSDNGLPKYIVPFDDAAQIEKELTAARAEVNAVTSQRDRLAELLEKSLKYIHTCPFKANCIEALQSLTTNSQD